MMTKNHKGSVRVDTPPPNVDLEQVSRSQLSRARTSQVEQSKRGRRSQLSSSNKYSKADTKFRPKNDFDLRLTKNDSLEIVRRRRSSLKSQRIPANHLLFTAKQERFQTN